MQRHAIKRPPQAASNNGDEALVYKAVRRAAEAVNVSFQQLAEILGLPRTRISRSSGALSGKHQELALLFIRCTRSLSALMDGDRENMAHWLQTQNRHLGAVPLELMETIGGLHEVSVYLDAMRAKI